MKDPVGDLCEMIKSLPREARERFLNYAFSALGHPKHWPNAAGELAELIGTVDELNEWMRRLVRDMHFDEHFLVAGLVNSTIEDQRGLASPEGRSEAVDFWIKRLALLKNLLGLPPAARAKVCTEEHLLALIQHAEEEVRSVDHYADIAQAVCEQIELWSTEIFDDAYWRERKAEIIRVMLGENLDEGESSKPDAGASLQG